MPEEEECCGSGCANCVWDIYDQRMEQYRKSMEQYEREMAAKK